LRSAGPIAGIKDSSGELVILAALSKEPELNAVRAVGNDGALSEALDRKLGNCVSGVAGVLPEFTLSLWNASRTSQAQRKEILARRLSELLSQLSVFPTPWGLKLIAELRFGVPAPIQSLALATKEAPDGRVSRLVSPMAAANRSGYQPYLATGDSTYAVESPGPLKPSAGLKITPPTSGQPSRPRTDVRRLRFQSP